MSRKNQSFTLLLFSVALLVKQPYALAKGADHDHEHHHHHEEKHKHKSTNPPDLAKEVAKEGQEEAEIETRTFNVSTSCEFVFSETAKHCRSRVDNQGIDPNDLKSDGIEKVSRRYAEKFHEAGDQNANFAGVCGEFAGTCLRVCRNSKSEVTSTSVEHCAEFQKHAQTHLQTAVQFFTVEAKANGTAQAASEASNGSSGSTNSAASSKSGEGSGAGQAADDGYTRRVEARTAFGKALLDNFGNSQGSPQGWAPASVDSGYAQQLQQPSDINQTADSALRNQINETGSNNAFQDQPEVSWSAPSSNEVSSAQSSPGYQPSSTSGSYDSNRMPSSGRAMGGTTGGGSGGGMAFGSAKRGNASDESRGGGEVRVEPMYRMIKVGNVDSASGNGSSEGHDQGSKSINMNDYLPYGSQYQKGYSPSGMDGSRQEIQPKATNIWGLISDRTRTLCAQKRLFDCN